MNRRIPNSREAITLASVRNWLRGPLYRLDFWRRQIPLALHVLREDGWVELLKAVRRKLRTVHFRPSASYRPAVSEIGALTLPTCEPNTLPRVSIVIPVFGQHLFTFNCLLSLGTHTNLRDVEIIVIDDASPVPLTEALNQVSGVRMVRNQSNLGFVRTCRRAGSLARGEYLVFLNNDIQVTADWLDALLRVFKLRSDAGMVGARLVYPDGRLQEAGGIVWKDGSAWNWGREGDPEHPAYRYLRRADYCSGACLAIKREDWMALGGFDEGYAPAYYEDTDLAFRVRELGKQVYYQPDATIIHYEGLSSGVVPNQGVKRGQLTNRQTFVARWHRTLEGHRPRDTNSELEVDRGVRARVLVVEATMITPDQDSGSVRLQAMLELLVELDCKVSFVADNLEHSQPYVHDLQQAGIEVWHAPYIKSVANLIRKHGSQYDVIIFCRHYVCAPYLELARRWAPDARIVFDTIDLHYLREGRMAVLEASASLKRAAEKTKRRELALVDSADTTLVVSPVEKELLTSEVPGADIRIVSNIHEPHFEGLPFGDRRGVLFVGGFKHLPNVDAVKWFLGDVWPLVASRNPELTVTIVGSHMPASLKAMASVNVTMAGFTPDLDALLKTARISIAPLRYGAGVKGKINQAMAWGIPVVATTVAAEGMGLEQDKDLLVVDSPEAFAKAIVDLCSDEALWNRLAENGRRNVAENFSRARARAVLEELLPRQRCAKT